MSSVQQNNYIQATFHVFMGEPIEIADIQKEDMFSPTHSSSKDLTPLKRKEDNQPQPSAQTRLTEGLILDFYNNLTNKNLNKTDLESFAQHCIEAYRDVYPSESSLRYRFTTGSSTDELLKLVFDHAFQAKPDVVIAAAEQVEGVSFYPKWKYVCWIKAPAKVGSILGSVAFKVVIAASVFFLSCHAGYRAYHLVEHLLKARGIPLLINNVSLNVIKAGNAIWDRIILLKKNQWNILIGFVITREVIKRGPQIPYVTQLVSNLSVNIILGFLFRSPQSIATFLITKTINFAIESWKWSGTLAALFTEAANSQNESRLAVCRKKAYATWITTINSRCAA